MIRATDLKSGGPGFKLSTLTLIVFIHVFSEFPSFSLGALCKTQLVCLLLVGIFKHYIYTYVLAPKSPIEEMVNEVFMYVYLLETFSCQL